MSRRLLLCVLFVSAAVAQNLTVVQGKLLSEESLVGAHLIVNLTPALTHSSRERAYVSNDGSFEFRDVPAGAYTVELTTANGDSIHRETINLTAPGDRIEIRLPQTSNKPGPATGTVSVRELKHPLTGKAKKLLLEARKASEKGEYLKAVDLLRGTMNDEAAVPFARMNIGVAYIRAGQPVNAIPELQEAVRLMPDDAVARTNLAYALLLANRAGAAEAECRKAIQLDKNSAKTRWVMGSILLAKGAPAEAVEHLRLASREIPKAKVLLAQAYEHNGQKEAAALELRQFLPQASNEDRVKVEQWLNKLVAK